jgi:hypothetical protein
MRDDENNWCQEEKGDERQFDIEKRQFDRIFEQEIFMCDGARRDANIEQHKEITQPKSRADGGSVLDAFADRLEIMRLLGELFGWISRRGRLFRTRRPRAR